MPSESFRPLERRKKNIKEIFPYKENTSIISNAKLCDLLVCVWRTLVTIPLDFLKTVFINFQCFTYCSFKAFIYFSPFFIENFKTKLLKPKWAHFCITPLGHNVASLVHFLCASRHYVGLG